MTSLTCLFLPRCDIEEIPELVGNLVNLKDLSLSCNRLNKLPLTFSSLRGLEKLNISLNKFEIFPSVVNSLTKLSQLDVTSNQIKEIDAEVLEKLRMIKILDLSDNKFSQN